MTSCYGTEGAHAKTIVEPFNNSIPGSTQGRICCLLAEEEVESSDKDIVKRNIWTLVMCFVFFTYNRYFTRRVNNYLAGQCPNMRLSCIGNYARNVISYKVGG